MLVKLLIDSWNVRGLGGRVKRDDVKAATVTRLPSILCLQESKLTDITTFFATSFLPPSPSAGASGGVITAWDDRLLQLTNHVIDEFSITTTFAMRLDHLSFSVINVYGPCAHDLKAEFLTSLTSAISTTQGPLAVIGDFNLIRAPKDKSNNNLFNDFINGSGLIEVPLLDRQFTWSNNQNPPIMARLDRLLVNSDWSLALPDSTLTSTWRPLPKLRVVTSSGLISNSTFTDIVSACQLG